MLAYLLHRIWANLFPKVQVEIEAEVSVSVEVDGAPAPVPPRPPAMLIADILDASVARVKQETGEDLSNWRFSIVDLLKLVGEDPSVGARRKLALSLGVSNYQPTEAGNVDLSKRFLAWLQARS